MPFRPYQGFVLAAGLLLAGAGVPAAPLQLAPETEFGQPGDQLGEQGWATIRPGPGPISTTTAWERVAVPLRAVRARPRLAVPLVPAPPAALARSRPRSCARASWRSAS